MRFRKYYETFYLPVYMHLKGIYDLEVYKQLDPACMNIGNNLRHSMFHPSLEKVKHNNSNH